MRSCGRKAQHKQAELKRAECPGKDFCADLNPCTSDDAHEEVGNNTCNCHHEALHYCHLSEERQDEVDEVRDAWVQARHEIDNGT